MRRGWRTRDGGIERERRDARSIRVTIMARSRAIIYRSLRSPRCRRNVHEGGKDNIEREKRGCKRPYVEGIEAERSRGSSEGER